MRRAWGAVRQAAALEGEQWMEVQHSRAWRAGGRVGPLSLPAVVAGSLGEMAHVEVAAETGVVTGGKSGLQALCGKGSAKHAVNAAVMTAW